MAENKKLQRPGQRTKLTEMINTKTDDVELNTSEDTEDDEGNAIIGKRVVLTDTKLKFELQSLDPTGFIKIKVNKGQVPEELSGMYTTPFGAQRAIEAYLNKQR